MGYQLNTRRYVQIMLIIILCFITGATVNWAAWVRSMSHGSSQAGPGAVLEKTGEDRESFFFLSSLPPWPDPNMDSRAHKL